MQMSTVESVKKKHKVNRVRLVLGCVILVLCAFYAFMIYCQISVHRGDPDHIVDASIAKIIGHNYVDSRNLTREEVILIVSDVFVQVKQKGFKETEDANVVMGRAIIMNMLEGDERGYRIKDLAKKEEALAFMGRGLGIPQYYGIESAPPDEIESSDWSAQPIENLIDQDCLSVDEILELGDLHELITVSKLKFVLSRVADAKIEKINSWRYDVLNNPFFHAMYMAGLFITGIIVSIMTLLDMIANKMSDKKLGENHNQKGEEQKRLEGQRRQEEEQKQPEEDQKQQEENPKRLEEQRSQEEERKQPEEEQKQQEESPKRLEEQRSQEEDQKKLEKRHNRWRKVQKRQGEGRMGRMENRRAKMRKNRPGKRTKRAKRRS